MRTFVLFALAIGATAAFSTDAYAFGKRRGGCNGGGFRGGCYGGYGGGCSGGGYVAGGYGGGYGGGCHGGGYYGGCCHGGGYVAPGWSGGCSGGGYGGGGYMIPPGGYGATSPSGTYVVTNGTYRSSPAWMYSANYPTPTVVVPGRPMTSYQTTIDGRPYIIYPNTSGLYVAYPINPSYPGGTYYTPPVVMPAVIPAGGVIPPGENIPRPMNPDR